ncbi:hypothetical protein K440DRAFT_535235 [Wilcoxina mikolae CBS 423.85]|nr:hypothetical protein K440DRAFT_535235 [Wilcoxina mikolae CBS 423.85]
MERVLVPKSIEFSQYILPTLPLDRYSTFFRMSPEMLLPIVQQIQIHSVFHNQNRIGQEPVHLQFAVTVRRLCCELSAGACILRTSQLFGIGEGTVVIYTRRVTRAMVEILWVEIIAWSGHEDKAAMKQ